LAANIRNPNFFIDLIVDTPVGKLSTVVESAMYCKRERKFSNSVLEPTETTAQEV
jgi:hypothetical protein